jgi:hypothetical protein
VLALGALAALAACAGGDAAYYDAYCRDRGLEPGSDAFKACVEDRRNTIEMNRRIPFGSA